MAIFVCGGALVVGGASIGLSGYGSTKEEARERAARAAKTVAEWSAQADLVASVWPLEAAADPLPPPAPWSPGTCRSLEAPEGGASASWAGGPPVVRGDAAAAVETARRLQCEGGTFALAATFAEVARLSPADKAAALRRGVDEAQARWRACWTAAPTLAPAPVPAVAAEAAAFACTNPDGSTGFGHTLDSALDDALATRTSARRHAALGAALQAAGNVDPAMKAMVLAQGIERWLGTPISDGALRASVSCGALPAATGAVRWAPPPTRECEVPAASAGPWSTPARQCDALAERGLALTAEAVEHADAEVRGLLALVGLGETWTCRARCAAAVLPPVSARVAVPGAPDRSTEAAAKAVLAKAVADHDLEALTSVLPSLPGSRLWEVLSTDPRSWDLLLPQLEGEGQWTEVGGAWSYTLPR